MFENGQTFDQFLNDYYTVGPKGYLKFMGRLKDGITSEEAQAEIDIKKILTADEANYYENAYARSVQLQFALLGEWYKILPKKPITAVGDSFKYSTSHNLSFTGLAPGGATTLFDGSETETGVLKMEKIMSPIMGIDMARDLHSMIHERLPAARVGGSDWEWMAKQLAPKVLVDQIDKWLGGYNLAADVDGVDTPAGTYIECVDRMISNKTESGTAATHVSLVTDGDIHWDGAGSALKIDRSEASGTWADAQIKLGGSGADTTTPLYLMEEIDDIVKAAKRYSENKNYIAVTSPATLNKIKDEHSPGMRYLPDSVKVATGINGVQTRLGADVGMDVQAIVTNGLKIPVFEMYNIPEENTVYVTDTSGHIYFIDLDHMYIRVDMPVTFLETGFGVEMLHQNYARSRAYLFTVAQLICDKFACHAAIKWIKA